MLKHFLIKEFVPPETWDAEGEQSITHIDERLLITADQIWEHFDSLYPGKVSMVINNWCYGGKFRYRGYRPPACTEGAKHSMHREIDGRLCGAFDADIYVRKSGRSVLMPAESVRQEIVRNRHKFPYLMRMEDGNGKTDGKEDSVTWVHCDIKGAGVMGKPITPLPPIRLFKL